MTEPAPEWRIGRHQAQNVYFGDRYEGVFFRAETASRAVAALNRDEAIRAQLAGAEDRLGDDLTADVPELALAHLAAIQVASGRAAAYVTGQLDALKALTRDLEDTRTEESALAVIRGRLVLLENRS